MRVKKFCTDNFDAIAAVITVAFLAIFTAVRYDLIYYNDDAMLSDIFSGAFSGSPSAMNNQMLYPISVVIAAVYRILPNIAWFELFLIVCQFFSIALIIKRILHNIEDVKWKILAAVVSAAFIAAFLLDHLVFITYTVTSGMLVCAAVFLFATDDSTDGKKLAKNSIGYIALYIVALCIRSELAEMLLPFVCLAGAYRWSMEEKIFTADNAKKYCGIFGVLIVAALACFFADNRAYSSPQWQDFRSFFDDRTTLYDYTGIPSYSKNEDFYKVNGITEEQFMLLRNYNYILDEEIDSGMLSTLADYAESVGPGLTQKAKRAIGAYRIQITDYFGTPYHSLMILGYIALILAVYKNGRIRAVLYAGVLLFTRTVIWLYILGQGRTPDRITHPLYWAEFILILAVVINEKKYTHQGNKNTKGIFMLIGGFVLSALFSQPHIAQLNAKYDTALVKAEKYQTVVDYCLENDDNFYMMPVLSVPLYPEKVNNASSQMSNFCLMGGWYTHNPLHYQKLEKYGIDNVQTALAEQDNVYLIQEKGYVSDETAYPFEWLVRYYESKGIAVEIHEVDNIVDDVFVYKVLKV